MTRITRRGFGIGAGALGAGLLGADARSAVPTADVPPGQPRRLS